MSKNSLTKKILATAFAMAGLTVTGSYAQTGDYDNPAGIMKMINSATKHQSGYKYKMVAPIRLFENRFADKSYTSGGELTGFAVPTTPTLNEIKSQEITYLNSTHHFNISTEQDTHTHSFYIGNTKYYYTPGDDKIIVNLANTGAAALETTTDTDPAYVFTDGTNYWKYNTTKLPDSVFAYGSGNSDDYNFKYNGSYHKTNLNVSKMKTSGKFADWEKVGSSSETEYNVDSSDRLQDANGVVEFKLTHNGAQETQYYKWTWNNPNNTEETGYFTTIEDTTISIPEKYFYNSTGSYNGGAVNIVNSTGSIEADFIYNNAINNGGAINIESGIISAITGDFVENSVYGNGGAICNAGVISSIKGDFVKNSADTNGGAIYNSGTISSIKGNFIGNHNNAIFNESDSAITSITGSFIGNSNNAVYNNGTITSITGDFIGNNSEENTGTILNNGTIASITGDFIGNGGGAIRNAGNITLSGNTFLGNYVDNSGTITPNSIYNNSGIINVANNATVTINDGYNGSSDAQLNIGLTANSGAVFNLSVENDNIQTDNLGIVKNYGTINWDLDVDLTGNNSDKITVTSLDGTKSIIIRAINLLNDKEGETKVSLTSNSTLINAYTLSSAIEESGITHGDYTYTVAYYKTGDDAGMLVFNSTVPGGSDINDYVQENEDGTVTITDNYEFSGSETWEAGKTDAQRTFKTTIATIDGAENTLTAEDGAKGMIIGEDTNLLIKDLTFSNFTTDTTDPATVASTNGVLTVLAGQTLTVKKVTIDNTNGKWGVINHGTFVSDPSHYSAQVFNDGTASFDNDEFLNITTGSAIENTGTATLTLTSTVPATPTSFHDNSGAAYGGAIYNHKNTSSTTGKPSLSATGVVFGTTGHGNTATTAGGAIWNDSVATITGSSFTSNSVTASGSTGGAIYNAGSMTIKDSSFTSNSAVAKGGAIYSVADLTISAENAPVEFSGNTASAGNDIWMQGTNAATRVTLNLNAEDDTNTITLTDLNGQYYDININSAKTGNVALGTVAGVSNVTIGSAIAGGGNISATTIDADALTLNKGTFTTTGASSIDALTTASGTTTTAGGDLTVLTGTNSGTIQGAGKFIVGNATDGPSTTYTNSGLIKNANIEIKSGDKLLTAASDTGVAGTTTSGIIGAVANAGTLELTGGTVVGAISGAGHTDINSTGTVTLGANVGQDINILLGTLKSDAGYLGDDIAIKNGGTLELIGGALAQNISGYGTTPTYGKLSLTTANSTYSGTAVVDALEVATGIKLTNSGSITVNNTFTNPATSEIALSGTSSALNLVKDDAVSNAGKISGSGTLHVGDDSTSTVLTNTGLISSSVNVHTGAKLNTAGVDDVTTPTSGLSGAVANAGTLELTGGTVVGAVSGAGHTDVKGNVTFGNTVSQAINVLTGKLTSSANYIGGAVDNTGANSLELTGGNLAKVVSGTSGTTDITGIVTLATGGAINEAMTISGTGASLTTDDASRIGGTVTNEVANGLVLQGGILSQNVVMTGASGSTKIQTGNVSINSANSIAQAIDIESGSLTASANSIGGAVTNAGTLTLVGGDLTKTVSGVGTVNIGDGTATAQSVTNSSTIAGDISIKSNGTLITSANNISDKDDNIANAGLLRLNGGRLLDKVTNTTNAIVEIAGDVVVNNDDGTGSGEIAGGHLKLSSGTLDLKNVTGETSGNIDLSGNGLIANGGTLSVQDGKMGSINLGAVDTSTSALNVAIDAQFTTGSRDTDNIFKGTADVITGSIVGTTPTNLINVSSITIASDPVATEFKAQIADDTSKGNVNFTGTTLTGLSAGAKSILVTYDNATGYITGKHSTLTDAIESSITSRMFSVGGDTAINGPLTLGGGSGSSLSITGNGKTISSTTAGNNGIIINGNTLSISNAIIGTAANKFGTAIDNATNADTVNLTDIVFAGNTVDVSNAGTLNLANTGTNTNSINAISGTGNTNVNSGTTTINTSLSQGTVNVGNSVAPSDANLTIDGTMAVTALNVNTAGSIFTNNGGTSSSPNSVSGTLTNVGAVENAGFLTVATIDNDNVLNNSGTLNTTTAFTNDGTVTNDGAAASITGVVITNNKAIVNQNGGSIASAINNEIAVSSVDNKAGSTISGAINNKLAGAKVDNAGTISGAVANTVAGTAINNAGLISGTVNNVASANVNNNAGGTITGNIINAGTLSNVETSTTKGILANVTNTGTFNNSGYVGGTGKTVANNGTGVINNTGLIASAITNSSTSIVNTTVSGFTGGITNDGIVNLAGTTTLANLGSAITNGAGGTGVTNIAGKVATGGFNISQTTVNIGSNGTTTPVLGELTNTNTITGNVILTSSNSVLLNAGTINGNLTNNGGTVTNYIATTDGEITGNVINTSGTIVTNASKIATTGASTIKNDGELSLTGGTISKEISKYSTGGTVEITDDVVLASSGSIVDNAIRLTSGTLDVGAKSDSSGNIDFTTGNIGTKLVANGGTLSVQDGKTGAINLGNIDTATYDKNLNIAIDADFVNGTIPVSRGIQGRADIITATSLSAGVNNNKIHISDIKLDTSENHPIGTEFTAQIADGAIAKSALDLTGTTVTSYRSGAGSILLTYDNTNGYLTGKHETLNDAITSSIDTKLYYMDGDSYTTVIDGTKTLGGDSLAITTNGNNITLDTTLDPTVRDGITIANSAQTLSIIGTKDSTHTANTTISGFKTAIDNAAGGTINLKDVTMSGNTTDVVNNGEGTNGLFVTGTSSLDTVLGNATGKGQTTIGNGDITIDNVTIGDVIQKNVKVLSDGVLNISADKLQTTAGTDNAGKLNISGTTTAGSSTILATDVTDVSGTGETNVTGNITINGSIEQAIINAVKESKLTFDGSITKANNINIDNAVLTLTNGAILANEAGTGSTAIDLTQTDTTVAKSSIILNAITADTTLENASITSSDNSGYAISAHSASGYKSTVNNAISGATSISADAGTSLVLTEKAMNSTTAPVIMGDSSKLTLANNGTASNVAMTGSVTGTNYTVDIINPSAAGSVDLKSSIAGANSINVKSGQLDVKIDNGGNIAATDVTLANNLSGIVFTTDNDYTFINNITGGGKVDDYTTPTSGSMVQLNGSGTNKFSIASNIEGATVTISNGELLLPNEDNLTTDPTNPSNVAVASDGTLNTMNNQTSAFNDTIFENGGGLKIDANVYTNKTDSFINPTELGNEKLINISVQGLDKIYNTKSVNLMNGTGLANLQADAGLSDLISSEYNLIITPVRLLKGQVTQTDEGLMLQFVPAADGYAGFNSAVLPAPIAAQIGGYTTQLHSYDEAFKNMDMYMLMTKEERQAMKFRNKFATSGKDLIYDPTVNQYENKAGWFRPYSTFENVGLSNGPDVSNVAYGTYAGGESEMYDLGHGWDGMWGVYVGYNGSHQAYGNHNSIYQNGGTLGLVGMAYKGNFFTGLTINAGANGAEASTMYGSENFSMLMAGIASKTGYNWELANGKFIIQPSVLASYSFVNTFDYRNAAGINISSDPLHAVQIEPGIKFIGNLKNGWQPYAGVSVVFNIMDKTDFHANEVALPDMSIKPFVKYGVGVRKSWGERFTAFFQTYFTSGGRNGVGLQTGLRWTIGKSPSNKTTLKTSENIKKTEIKGK